MLNLIKVGRKFELKIVILMSVMKMKILIFLFCFVSGEMLAQTSLDTAVNFTVKDVNGITYHLNDILLQNKIVVLDFFTTTCGPCITYAPLISESYNHFGCNG